MISKKQIKLIKSLQIKKYREKYGLFVCEGKKIITELTKSNFKAEKIFTTVESEFIKKNFFDFELIKNEDLKKISSQKNPQELLALVKIKHYKININEISDDISLILDGIQDPGNLGSIIRTANWFGIKHIVCSPDTVDMYNPKVVQASMGAIFGVKLYYTELSEFLRQLRKNKVKIFGTYMDGKNFFDISIPKKSAIIFGNEGKGISNLLGKFIQEKITIPHCNENLFVDSLNVAVSVSIVLGQVCRTN